LSDDTRMALGIPRAVPTSKGTIEVRPLSAVQFIVLTEQVVEIGKAVRRDAAADGDIFGALQRVLASQPTKLTGLLSSATGWTAEDLGDLPLDEFLDVVIAFVDQHEKSIARFFELRTRWENLTAKTRPSPNSSTRSSAPAGPSPTSAPSASNSSNATPDLQPSGASTST